MTINTVLFDLDGTLVDSSIGFILAMNKTLADYDQCPMDDDSIRELISAGARTIIQRAWAEEISREQIEQIRDDYIREYQQYPERGASVYPGLPEWLNRARQHGIKLGVVTNKPECLAKPIIESLELSQYLDVLICPDHVKTVKPDPEGILLAINQLKSDPAQTLYCGDHSKDIAAAAAAGVRSLACGYGFYPREEDFHDWPADYHADNSEHAVNILTQLCNMSD
ncbi:putative phosphatase [Gynuella sunshinyii YC6258]|uniref:Putative phosphatase n=2 Tax=Gynuella sunshinyii TaxID=1445505 RepID=A0A0C5W189_9GAMM|nr:putative phosphatase [Gynuella sunshinyii YC6258]